MGSLSPCRTTRVDGYQTDVKWACAKLGWHRSGARVLAQEFVAGGLPRVLARSRRQTLRRGGDAGLQIPTLAEAGTKDPDPCRKQGSANGHRYRWRNNRGGVSVKEAKRLKEREGETPAQSAGIAGGLEPGRCQLADHCKRCPTEFELLLYRLV